MSAVSKSAKINSKFEPRYIAGCTLWLDGNDRSSNSMTLSGSDVTVWKDKSISGNNTTVGGAAPVLATFAGRNGISFGPVSSYYTLTPSLLPNGTSSFSVFGVISPLAYLGNDYMIVNWGTSTNPNAFRFWVNGSTGGLRQDYFTGSTVNSDTANILSASAAFSNTSTTTATRSFINGNAFSTNTSAVSYNIGTTFARIGTTGTATLQYLGVIHEIIIYNRSLSTTERQQVEGYLGEKWALQSGFLPVGHPYISRNPVLTTYAPTEISGCVGWIDASDTTSFTLSGSTVSSITNKNGGGTIAISGSPTWTYNGLNGTYPAFGTNSGGFRLALASSLTNFTHTAFIVTSYSSTPTTAGTTPLAFATASGGSTVFFRVFDFLTGPPARYRTIAFFGTLYSSSATIGPAAANTPFLYSSSFTGTTPINAYYYAGTQTATITAASPAANASHCMIGLDGFTTTTYWQNGRIAEVIIFNRVLTDTERYNIDSYLSYKWGMRGNIPVGHPYKNFPPLKIN